MDPARPSPATILVVDDDAGVRQVLGRVLTREGHTVLEAGDAAKAVALTEQHHPQLAVLDLCLGDGDGGELAGHLHARQAGLPLILITGFPLRLHEKPELSRPFRSVLTKPVDVNELRLAVNTALSEGAMQQPNSTPAVHAPEQAPPPAPPAHMPTEEDQVARDVSGALHAETHAHPSWGERIRSAVVVVVALLVLAGFVLYVVGVPIPGLSSAAENPTVTKDAPARIEILSKKGEEPKVLVPEDVRRALGIRRKDGGERLAAAEVPTEARPLVLSGSTGLDPNRIVRVRARFAPAKVMEIGQTEDLSSGTTTRRDLRSGDFVHKDDLLGVFYSVDVGNKKNDLVDALLQLKIDESIVAGSQAAYDKGALPLLDLLAAKKAVAGDENTIDRAEQTLRAWEVPEADIEAVHKEAEAINARGGKRDRDPQHLKDQLHRWAKVELRAPEDGTIVERNANVGDTIVDNTLNLFQIARVQRILVSANAPEDLAPTLNALNTAQRRWVVHTAGAPVEGVAGPIDDISYVIDVNQHSAVVKGYIPNPEGVIRGGQYATVTIRLPAPQNVVEIPNDALADDGKQAVVFVQDDPNKPGVYTMRRVEIVLRLDKTVLVRSRLSGANGEPADQLPPTPQEKDDGLLPRHALKPGDRVITAGVLEIKKEFEDRQSEGDAAKSG